MAKDFVEAFVGPEPPAAPEPALVEAAFSMLRRFFATGAPKTPSKSFDDATNEEQAACAKLRRFPALASELQAYLGGCLHTAAAEFDSAAKAAIAVAVADCVECAIDEVDPSRATCAYRGGAEAVLRAVDGLVKKWCEIVVMKMGAFIAAWPMPDGAMIEQCAEQRSQTLDSMRNIAEVLVSLQELEAKVRRATAATA